MPSGRTGSRTVAIVRGASTGVGVSLLVAAAALLGAACAGRGEHAAKPTEQERAELEHIERELAAGRWDYETGLELIANGQARLGSDVLQAASRRLRAASKRCADSPECEPGTIKASLALVDRWQPDPVRGPKRNEESEEPQRSNPPKPFAAPEQDEGLLDQIEPNDHVLAALNEWLTWRRDELADARRRYKFLRASMAPIYEEAGLPESLLFGQVATESAGKVHAYSRSGAVGPLQFMRVTALRYGLRTIDGFDTRLDPEAATRANVAYLQENLEQFDGDLALVVAAYNGGETRLRRLKDRHPGASFWDEQIYYSLPRETRRHVPRVFAAALLFMSPEDYGLAPRDDWTSSGTLTLPAPTALGEIAVCLGSQGEPNGWFRILRNLNPSIDPSERLPAGTQVTLPSELIGTYARRCGEDEPWRLQARVLHDAEYPEQPPVERYVVRRGDTLNEIVGRFSCISLTRLARINDVHPPDYVIQPGQRLTVPRCP
jgi:membrane-bound lytic murein transglycosylase D